MDGASAGACLRLCRRKYLSEPFRLCLPLNDSAKEEGTKCRNRFSPMAAPWESTASREGKQPEGLQHNEYRSKEYLPKPCKPCPPLNNSATEKGTKCRNRYSPTAAPWELTATREGKQPEGLQQKRSCKIPIASDKTTSPFLISISFAIFKSFCKNKQFA